MDKGLKYVFGPVPSRRLGRSLGVNPIPFKTCNYACVYCQLGKAINFTNKRELFFSPSEMAEEIVSVCRDRRDEIDYITFVGEGEPTLYLGLHKVTEAIRSSCDAKMAIITNGALFHKSDVRWDVELFDVILTKIDAPNETIFRRINRPYRGIKFRKVVEGLIALRGEFKGEMWIETMLVKGINDDEDVLKDLCAILDKINPDKRFVSIPTRPPAEKWVEIPSSDTLFRAFKILNAIPIYDVEYGEFNLEGFGSLEEAVVTLIRRHPLREDELERLIEKYGLKENVKTFVDSLVEGYGIKVREHFGHRYLLPKEAKI